MNSFCLSCNGWHAKTSFQIRNAKSIEDTQQQNRENTISHHMTIISVTGLLYIRQSSHRNSNEVTVHPLFKISRIIWCKSSIANNCWVRKLLTLITWCLLVIAYSNYYFVITIVNRFTF